MGDPDPGSLSTGKCRVHGVGCFLGGFRGSRMWNILERLTEGACGDRKALTGIDAWDMLRRDAERLGPL